MRSLGHQNITKPSTTPGLVIIQIDGLSYSQLNKAIKNGRMPCLKKLLQEEHYQLHHLYSGLPSTTPAVQGELFYGIKTAVPAFSYKPQMLNRVVRMYEQPAVIHVEQGLKKKGKALLTGGSSYSNNFEGGATEANFCPSSLGWKKFIDKANPLTGLLIIILNLISFIRVATLVLLEFILAIFDFFRGIINGRDLVRELLFVPTRVAICILLRELIVIGVKLDLVKGLPIIHANFLGYDEQAHRRGPGSKFAHWSLKGIDDAISRIWQEAKGAKSHEYDIWIHSDHGQEETLSYEKKYGINVVDAINQVIEQSAQTSPFVCKANGVFGIQYQRLTLLGGKILQKLLRTYANQTEKLTTSTSNQNACNGYSEPFGNSNQQHLVVSAMGSLGHIYFPRSFERKKLPEFALNLVDEVQIPMVFIATTANKVKVWTKEGIHLLPNDAKAVFGENHPFLTNLIADILRLCHHPDAGDIVICGWHPLKPYLTFALENGSHGGPGFEETHAFAMLPQDTVLPKRITNYLRPKCLYLGALHLLNRQNLEVPITVRKPIAKTVGHKLRVMTYNVHSCIGMDGKLSPHRIARVISQYQPDVISLQELDVGKSRSGKIDQAYAISKYLQMTFHFHPVMHVEEEQYGNAILTHLPVKLVRAGNYPYQPTKPNQEPRGVIWVEIILNGKRIQVLNTHLGLTRSERQLQVATLLGSKWISSAKERGPVILCGDFNAFPHSSVHKSILSKLQDVQMAQASQLPRNTFFGRFPTVRIDHIFVDETTKILYCDVPRSKLSRTASDHLPLVTDIQI
ncbi:endonuclease/exonuclease/phosphatase family protein [Aliiglaciecola sp.]|nr:endonuclease/exonuclease/phosphatase family protein [Aliiglaciecola sp.]